jgi:RNA polymerase sigma-70 factor (ECF subfamily)
MQEFMTATTDSDEFARLAGGYRRELLAYCYRMLGSVDEAEDQVQETLLRAWRGYAGFQGRASLRTWLYRIATNSCLRALETRARRPLPSGLGGPAADAEVPVLAGRADLPWLQPVPDALALAADGDPAIVAASRASMRLALIAALQYLPARQRAVLVLRDVLGWRAAEVADLLGTTVAAANSMLQRARAQIAREVPDEDEIAEPADPAIREVLDRYATAFENADVARLTELLRDDAVLEMPPLLTWFAGRELIGSFLAHRVVRPGGFRLVPVAANGQAAFAAYLAGPDGAFRAHAIQVLAIRDGQISRIVSFNEGSLLALFGMPADYSAVRSRS